MIILGYIIERRTIEMAILSDYKQIHSPGIDSLEMVNIGGIQQALYFRGENIKNPVILFLHGGPGWPEIPFLHDFQYPWEAHFTIVHWDQRNAGKTFFQNDPEAVLETLCFERALEDAQEVTLYIKKRLNQHKIIILGYSWGSVLGSALVKQFPENFLIYIGLGQAINLIENERIGFNKLLELVMAKGDDEEIKSVKSLAPYPPPKDTAYEIFVAQLFKIRGWQIKYGIATGSELKHILLSSPYYTEKDKEYYGVNISKYQRPIFEYLLEFDIHTIGTTYDIPMVYIMGERDYQTPHILAKEFFEKISAPYKAFYLIPNAGHGAMHDNKEEFNRVLLQEINSMIQSYIKV